MEAARQATELPMSCVEAGLAARRRLLELRWAVHHEEELRTKDCRRIAIVLGTTTPFGGATLGSLLGRGAASVAFLLRIEEVDAERTAVTLHSAGTEGWTGLDWGRNEGVARRFLDGLATL